MSLESYGDYQLLKRLATGGMAQIYLARQRGPEGFEKLLVVKRILPHLAENEEFIRMFLDEARIAARLNHPNIVQIFNLGALGDSFFIAMEYIHGEDVRKVSRRAEHLERPFPVPLVCRVIMDSCAGLDHAHKKTDASGKPLGIVHRDVSPQNILVTFEGGVKVVDFGIAKAADQATVTRSGVIKGKYSYMSPEQAAGKKLDHRTDVFALGVVFYELLTGQRLFKRSNEIATLAAVGECEVPAPSAVNPRLPADLDAIVLKALAKDPDRRFQEAVHFQMALEGWLLENRQPSSSAHLAAFMGELYADRLAQEAAEGHFLVADNEASKSRQDGSVIEPLVSRSSPKPAPSIESERRAGSLEATKAARGGRTQPSRASLAPERDPEPSMKASEVSRTQKDHDTGSRRWVAAVVAVAAIAGIGAGLYASRSRPAPSPAPVTEVIVPKDLPQPTPQPPAPVEAALTKVDLWVKTEPQGARILIEGVDRGVTPLRLEAEPGSEVALVAESPGYKPKQQTVRVGLEAMQEVSLTLEKRPRAEVPKSSGTVSFVVPLSSEIYPDVHCDGQYLGELPFKEKRLTAGEHVCRFVHPALGTKIQKVIVRPNEKTVVTVSFEGSK